MQQLVFSPFSGTSSIIPTANPLSSLIDKLFSLPSAFIEGELASYALDDSEDDLLSGIWNHSQYSHEQKVKLVGDVAPHIPFVDSMCSLFHSDPLSAQFILVSLENEVLARQVLDSFLNDIDDYRTMIETWSLLANSGWDDPSLKSEPLELMLALMTPEERARLFNVCFTDNSPEVVAKLSSLLISAPFTTEFANGWGGHFEQDDDLEDQLSTLVRLIIVQNHPCLSRPPILTALMNFEGETNDFDQVLFDNLDKFSEADQSIVLWCIPIENLSYIFEDFDAEYDRDKMLGYLNKILSRSDSIENKVRVTSSFVNRIRDEEVLIAWLMAMVDCNSPAIPYIWIAFRNELFSFIVTDPGSNSLRTQLLNLATSRPIPHFQEYIQTLTHNPERLTYLINLCTMDIASQTQVQVANQMFAKWMSFNDVGEYLLDGVIAGDLSEKMTRFQTDFKRVPPLFFAIGMTLPMQRQWIIPSAIYCSDTQLKAIAQMMPEEENFDTLEQMTSKTMFDQFKTVFTYLPPILFRKYITWKGAQTQRHLTELRETTRLIRMRIEKIASKQEESETFYNETFNICCKQAGRINIFGDFKLLHLRNLCSEKALHSTDDVWAVIPGCIISSNLYKERLLGSHGLMKQLEGLAPSQPESLAFNIDFLPFEYLQEIGAESWAEVGIKSTTDLQHLGFKGSNYDCLETYLGQPDLLETWSFLDSKHLRDIDTLITNIIATPEELFDLKTFSQKL